MYQERTNSHKASAHTHTQKQDAAGPQEVLLFRDYSGWEEPALSTPFGFMSLRNLAVLGLFGMLSYVLYATLLPENLSIGRDYIMLLVSLAPLAAGLVIGIIKTPYGTADTLIISLIVMMLYNHSRSTSHDSRQKGHKRQKSRVLGFARMLRADTPQGDRIHEIICADLDELKSIRITIHAADGSLMANRLVKCYMDDILVESIHTGSDGSLVLHVRPEREGGRMLTVRDHKNDRIMLKRPLHFSLGSASKVG